MKHPDSLDMNLYQILSPALQFQNYIPLFLAKILQCFHFLGSVVFLVLPVYIDNAADRLGETKRRMDELKESPEITMGFIALGALGMAPLPIAKRAGTYFADKATAVMSNVPGPKKAIYLAGTKVKNIMFWAPRTGRMGLGLSIISYNDHVTLGIAVDEGLAPDPEVIIEGFLKEFSDLLTLAEG